MKKAIYTSLAISLILVILPIACIYYLYEDAGKRMRYYKARPAHLDILEDPKQESIWDVFYYGFDNSTPPRKVRVWMRYYSDRDIFCASSEVENSDERFTHTFSGKSGLVKIVDYIKDNQSVFFDYSEYKGNKPLMLLDWGEGSEGFSLDLINRPYFLKYRSYRIVKTIGGSMPEIPEVRHVLEMIKTEYINELMLHPD